MNESPETLALLLVGIIGLFIFNQSVNKTRARYDLDQKNKESLASNKIQSYERPRSDDDDDAGLVMDSKGRHVWWLGQSTRTIK